MTKALAILCSDIHLSHVAPVARSAEPDWYRAMERPIAQLHRLCAEHGVPLVIAGDIYDRWNAPAELINFAIDVFGVFTYGVFAIPGQHDLPNHRMEEIHRSAFATLIRSGKVQMLKPGHESRIGILSMRGFPWNVPVRPVAAHAGAVQLAVVHEYIWKEGCSYPGADEGKHYKHSKEVLKGYDAAVYGDNHKGFLIGSLLNGGTLLRRKADEIEYKPHVGILMDDGTIVEHFLDTSEDRFLEEHLLATARSEEQDTDVSTFLNQLKELAADPLDFREAVVRTLDNKGFAADSEVRRIALQCLEVV